MPTQSNRDYLLLRGYQAGITSSRELAAFMGQMEVESGGFNRMHEHLNYSGKRLLEVFPGRNGISTLEQANAVAQGGPEAVGNAIYGGEWGQLPGKLGNTEPGDGWRFHGRGYIQLTGRENYTRAARELGLDLVGNPDLAAERETAANVALHYWRTRVVINGSQLDVRKATYDINGGYNHLSERTAAVARWERTLTPEVMDGLARGDVLAPPAPGRRQSSDPVIAGIQQNLNILGIPDARGQPLVVDGIRGGPGSRTSEAIVAFQTQAGLSVDQSRLQSTAALLVATEAALDARNPLRGLRRAIESLDQRDSSGDSAHPQSGASQSGGMPDFLLPGRDASVVSTAAAAVVMESPQTDRNIPPMERDMSIAPTGRATATTLAALPQSDLQPGDRGQNITALQQHLSVLGATDRGGQALHADGHYGPRTRDAVEQFQLWSGREVTGIADKGTLQALATQSLFAVQQREHGQGAGRHLADNLIPSNVVVLDAAERRDPSISSLAVPRGDAESRGFAYPGHPQHALYAQLKSVLPEYTSEQRLAQFTAALHVDGIKPGDLQAIDINAQGALFTARWGASTSVALGADRPPPVEQSMQMVDTHNQGLQEQAAQREHAGREQQNTPAMQH